MKVCVLILDFLKADRVVQNVNDILAQTVDFDVHIRVIDNSCNKQNAQILKDNLKNLDSVSLKISAENLGYTKGNNWGAKDLTADFFFIVNPDIAWPHKDTLQKTVHYLINNPTVGICGPKQINEDSQARAMSVRKFPNLFLQIARRTFFRHIPGIRKAVEVDECLMLNANKTQDVDWLQSSCFLIRGNLWKQFKGFDEDYFLFMADTQICLNCWKVGYRVVFFAETSVGADGIRCSSGGFKAFLSSWILRQHLNDSITYFRKNLKIKNPRKTYYQTQKATQ